MKVQDKIKKCVAFVALQLADRSFLSVGTVFFIIRNSKANKYTYAVTAKHVIEGIKNKGLDKVIIRLNMKDGTLGIAETKVTEWIYHNDSNIDIAILPFQIYETVDHNYYPETWFLSDTIIQENEIDVGDEIFVTGLFSYHQGKKRNLPIIRIGNIAAMPGEKIQTKMGLIDAYLIEARSTGGLSGSPVFLNVGLVRRIKGKVLLIGSEDIYHLLGIIHGHFETKENQIDLAIEDITESNKINTGIAIVTPIKNLMDLFEQDAILKLEKDADVKLFTK